METLKGVVETHKRTLVGTIIGGVAGYYLATKAFKAETKLGIGIIVAISAVAGSIIQDKAFSKKTTVTISKTGTADVTR